MDFNFKDKNIFVTGSSRGIGFEIANAFALQDANVVLNSRNPEECQKASSKVKNSSFVCADMTDAKEAKSAIDKVIEILGSIDVIVCNVGNGKVSSHTKGSLEEWQEMLKVNLFSTINTVNYSREHLKITKGSIICISSICGHEVIKGAPVSYSASKAALNAYIKGMAWQLSQDKVRIIGISPGNINFPGSTWEQKINSDKKSVKQMLSNEVPQNRFGETRDISSSVLFLASKKSAFITGTILVVDGGQSRT
tara:strand:- start:940 stop:1695 length:756 start_codon:yes stop_codon:yes gene_type:complete